MNVVEVVERAERVLPDGAPREHARARGLVARCRGPERQPESQPGGAGRARPRSDGSAAPSQERLCDLALCEGAASNVRLGFSRRPLLLRSFWRLV